MIGYKVITKVLYSVSHSLDMSVSFIK